MFESISESLQNVFSKFGRLSRLTEKNIAEGMKEVRIALLEADVNYKVVKDFTKKVTEKAVGQEVVRGVNPAQQIVKIVHDELVELMGESDVSIPYNSDGVTVIMLAGLQGSGKTTTAAKLAKYIQKKGHKPMLVAADTQRPAAIQQLQVLGEQIKAPVYSRPELPPPIICYNALEEARTQSCDVVILDTAGRLHIDDELMRELEDVVQRAKPHQTYLVCDSMTGQDAVNSAKEFDSRLPLDGVILTKLDGDARGGAAISLRAVTGKPIKFVGIGEKLDNVEEFHPDRMASRILGMGDVVTLVEKAQELVTEEEAAKLQEKMLSRSLTLEDFLSQLQQIQKMGSVKDLLAMMPGMGAQVKGLDIDENEFSRVKAIIQAMTLEERQHPELITGSRRQRVATGSGTQVPDVNRLLKQFKQMKDMMSRKGRFGKLMEKMMPGFAPGAKSNTKAKLQKKKKQKKKHKRR